MIHFTTKKEHGVYLIIMDNLQNEDIEKVYTRTFESESVAQGIADVFTDKVKRGIDPSDYYWETRYK